MTSFSIELFVFNILRPAFCRMSEVRMYVHYRYSSFLIGKKKRSDGTLRYCIVPVQISISRKQKKLQFSFFILLIDTSSAMSTAQQRKYKSLLVQMMSYLDGFLYGIETEFLNERLIKLMLEVILIFLEMFRVKNPKEEEKQ